MTVKLQSTHTKSSRCYNKGVLKGPYLQGPLVVYGGMPRRMWVCAGIMSAEVVRCVATSEGTVKGRPNSAQGSCCAGVSGVPGTGMCGGGLTVRIDVGVARCLSEQQVRMRQRPPRRTVLPDRAPARLAYSLVGVPGDATVRVWRGGGGHSRTRRARSALVCRIVDARRNPKQAYH
eukprot:1348811-Pyramimonas_sp.AAC.1